MPLRSLRLKDKAEAANAVLLEQQASKIRTQVSRIDVVHNLALSFVASAAPDTLRNPVPSLSPTSLDEQATPCFDALDVECARMNSQRAKPKVGRPLIGTTGLPVKKLRVLIKDMHEIPIQGSKGKIALEAQYIRLLAAQDHSRTTAIPSKVTRAPGKTETHRYDGPDAIASAATLSRKPIILTDKEREMSALELVAYRAHKEKRRLRHRDWRYATYAKRDGLTLAQVFLKYSKTAASPVAATETAPSRVDAPEPAPTSLDAQLSAVLEAIDSAQTLLEDERARRSEAKTRAAARRRRPKGAAALRCPPPIISAAESARRARRRASSTAWRARKSQKLVAAEELLLT